jgi:hypothetical protein
MDKHKNYGKVP